MKESVAVVGVGLLNAVGLSAREVSSSIDTGTSRFMEMDWRDGVMEPIIAAFVPEEGLSEAEQDGFGPVRAARLVRLAEGPLFECLGGQSGIPLFVGLPDMETGIPLDTRRCVAGLSSATGGAVIPSADFEPPRGRCAGLLAIEAASQAVRSGNARFAIAGGVDSYVDPYILATLDLEKRLKSGRHLDGFIPGEGAAFVLLARPDVAAASGLSALALISRVSTGLETGHLYSEEPYRGDGLSRVVADLFQSEATDLEIRDAYLSMNGESHWVREWGVTRIRNRRHFAETAGTHHPADCTGDLGAAAGPTLVALAAMAIADGFRDSPALVVASSDRGDRAAVVVTKT